jgi:hypothetical protein
MCLGHFYSAPFSRLLFLFFKCYIILKVQICKTKRKWQTAGSIKINRMGSAPKMTTTEKLSEMKMVGAHPPSHQRNASSHRSLHIRRHRQYHRLRLRVRRTRIHSFRLRRCRNHSLHYSQHHPYWCLRNLNIRRNHIRLQKRIKSTVMKMMFNGDT